MCLVCVLMTFVGAPRTYHANNLDPSALDENPVAAKGVQVQARYSTKIDIWMVGCLVCITSLG